MMYNINIFRLYGSLVSDLQTLGVEEALSFPVVCSIGFSACKWCAEAKIPVPVTPPLDYFSYFLNIVTSLCNMCAPIGSRSNTLYVIG